MKKFIFLAFLALIFSVQVFAHQAFTLISSEKKAVKEAELALIEKNQTAGKKDKTTLTFTEKEIRLVVTTGPEDDMLSYLIQGMRNPTLVVPTGAKLMILFVNVDVDMRHDIRFGHVPGEFPLAPEIVETAGSTKLAAKAEDEMLQAEEMVIKANDEGLFKYFCSIRGHAKGGMWGNIAVGVKPGDLKQPKKTEHIHSEDEDHDVKETPKKPVEKVPDNKKPDEKKPHDMENMNDMDHKDGEMKMSSTINIGDAMSREGSGTSWLPDSAPMHAYMKMYEDGGMLMLMGTVFVRYTQIGSTRDVSASGKGDRNRFDAPNMFMAMYSRPVGDKSQFGFRVMASLDPLTQRGYGYPLLYQSGELFDGQPIHDRQHPHDFISELAASFSHKVNEKQSFFIYGGIAGEPALGPPMFMHRPSALNNPDAPIGHHWQDASHITWGVATGGYSFGKFKVEASVFNGTEPDENRWGFDRLRLNSFSTRFSFNPTKDWAFQFSHGYLTNPERAEPDLESLRRTTASAMYNKRLGEEKNWASTFVWGQNYKEGHFTNSYLFESDYTFGKNAVFGRIEQVQKDGHELVLDEDDHDEVFRVGSYSIGYVRDLVKHKGIDVGLGGMATFNTNPSALVPYYGGTKHAGWQLFLRIRPSKVKH